MTFGPDTASVVLSLHAIARFRERLRPALTFDQAERELERLVAGHAQVEPAPPVWLADDVLDGWVARPADFWLTIGEDIGVPVCGGVAVTVLARGGLHPGLRRHLTRARRQGRQARRAISNDQGAKGRGRAAKSERSRERRLGRPDGLEAA